MANPPGNHQQEANHPSPSFNGAHLNNGNPAPDTLGSGLKHNPGISMDWTLEEQAILEDGLKTFALDLSITRYAKIAMNLQNKTVRDVALRCRWMNKKETSKRRKEEHSYARKSKDKKERVVDPSAKSTHFAGQSSISQYPTPMISVDYNDGIPLGAIGGVAGELLEQNAQALNQISENLASFKIQENIGLLYQTRDNLLKLMNEMNDVPDIMKQMPQLPVKLNLDLANTILPPPPPSM
ncbi:acetate--CoA ligase ACS [Hibiscus syriacus]|uniref:Acetate--CoA ligase ACS n=1 Tax=Hibiscus syriacus TaxID=106335 RepID=A0A6A2XIV2_HIBSY|nr:uncharacterized protein LOC120191938 [Hibiscus syriacus]KAE8658399.1 acetate--CoA ligase ACS [Hibiscus syriacus]